MGRKWCRKHLHQSAPRFLYFGVPAPVGMSDCYESMSRTTIRDRLPPPVSSFQRKLESRRGGERQDHHTMAKPRRIAIFILLCGLRKAMVIPANACPVPRYGARIQGVGRVIPPSNKRKSVLKRRGLSPTNGPAPGRSCLPNPAFARPS